MKPGKKAGSLSRGGPAPTEAPEEWTPYREERRQGGGPQDGVDGRREVDRAKEDKGGEDDSGGPDA